MDSQIMFQLVATKSYLAFLFLLLACTTDANNKNIVGVLKYKFEDPDTYQVDPKDFPTFRVESSIPIPPLVKVRGGEIREPREGVKSTDVWEVTHVYKGNYYIFSPEYEIRQKDLIKRTYSWKVPPDYYVDHVIIQSSGKVIGGWISFKNKKYVLLSTEREIVLDPEYWRNPQWDSLPKFKRFDELKKK